MHELSLTQSAVDAIIERVGDARVISVRLEIGKLSGVVVDSVRFCFDLVVAGTVLDGARLEVDEPSGEGRCRRCGTDFATDDPIVLCPACDSADVALHKGLDVRIRSVEVSAKGAASCAPPVVARTEPELG